MAATLPRGRWISLDSLIRTALESLDSIRRLVGSDRFIRVLKSSLRICLAVWAQTAEESYVLKNCSAPSR